MLPEANPRRGGRPNGWLTTARPQTDPEQALPQKGRALSLPFKSPQTPPTAPPPQTSQTGTRKAPFRPAKGHPTQTDRRPKTPQSAPNRPPERPNAQNPQRPSPDPAAPEGAPHGRAGARARRRPICSLYTVAHLETF